MLSGGVSGPRRAGRRCAALGLLGALLLGCAQLEGQLGLEGAPQPIREDEAAARLLAARPLEDPRAKRLAAPLIFDESGVRLAGPPRIERGPSRRLRDGAEGVTARFVGAEGATLVAYPIGDPRERRDYDGRVRETQTIISNAVTPGSALREIRRIEAEACEAACAAETQCLAYNFETSVRQEAICTLLADAPAPLRRQGALTVRRGSFTHHTSGRAAPAPSLLRLPVSPDQRRLEILADGAATPLLVIELAPLFAAFCSAHPSDADCLETAAE